MQPPKWLSYLTALFSLSFLIPGLLLCFSPPATILAIYSSFGLDGISDGVASALVNAFTGLQARNIVIALVTLLVAFRDLRLVLLLWGLRLLVETADLIIALAQNRAAASLLPVIGGFLLLELVVLGAGYRSYRRAAAATPATSAAAPVGAQR